jgi:hypothetical protein
MIQAEIRNRQPTKDREGTGRFVPVGAFAQRSLEMGNLFM